MKPLVECCIQNLSKKKHLLEKDPLIQQTTDFITYPCLNHCSLCAKQNYVLFEGEILASETLEKLQETIIKHAVEWTESI